MHTRSASVRRALVVVHTGVNLWHRGSPLYLLGLLPTSYDRYFWACGYMAL